MKWVAISGSWRKNNKILENDVRSTVREIMSRGDGIVSGGALGVDYFATDEAIKFNPKADRIKIFLPVTLEHYAKHYQKRAGEGVITKQQAEELINQLTKLKEINPAAIIENLNNIVVDKTAYYERNSAVIEVADELEVFHVNESLGTQDAFDKARVKGIPVRRKSYIIK